MSREIPLSAVTLADREMELVLSTLQSGVLSRGPMSERFEDMIAERTRRRHAIAVSSGTAGIHLTLAALGIGEGDEVITSPFSHVSTANSIVLTGAKPVFVDIDPVSLNVDPDKVSAAVTDRTKVIVALETFGNPVTIDRIAQVAARNEIPLIEDAGGGIGGVYKDRPIGSFGRAAVFSFHTNQQLTTGEGGVIVTDDDRLADACRLLRDHGRAYTDVDPDSIMPGSMHYRSLGFSYRMSELHAALGVGQMERLDDIIQMRREVACFYVEKLMTFPDLILPAVTDQTESSAFTFVVRLSDEFGGTERNRVLCGMRRHEVGCTYYYPPVHLQSYLRDRYGFEEGNFPVTESIAQRTLALPFFPQIDGTQVELVCLTLQVMLQREKLLKPD